MKSPNHQYQVIQRQFARKKQCYLIHPNRYAQAGSRQELMEVYRDLAAEAKLKAEKDRCLGIVEDTLVEQKKTIAQIAQKESLETGSQKLAKKSTTDLEKENRILFTRLCEMRSKHEIERLELHTTTQKEKRKYETDLKELKLTIEALKKENRLLNEQNLKLLSSDKMLGHLESKLEIIEATEVPQSTQLLLPYYDRQSQNLQHLKAIIDLNNQIQILVKYKERCTSPTVNSMVADDILALQIKTLKLTEQLA
ncbi:MAG: hypothetical protein ACRC2V_10495 [Xenococcaceae cyanobacterium]